MSVRSKTSVKPSALAKRAKALLKPSAVKDTISEKNDKKIRNKREADASSESSLSDEEDLSSLQEDESKKGAGKLTPKVGFKNTGRENFLNTTTTKRSMNLQTPLKEFSANRKLADDENSECSMRSQSSYRSFDNKS